MTASHVRFSKIAMLPRDGLQVVWIPADDMVSMERVAVEEHVMLREVR